MRCLVSYGQPANPKRQKTVTFDESPGRDQRTASPHRRPETLSEDDELEDDGSDFENVSDLGFSKPGYSWTSSSRPIDYEASEGTLQNRLVLALEENRSVPSRKDFIPKEQLELLINEKSVTDELRRVKRAFRNWPRRFLEWFKKGGRTIEEEANIICNGYPQGWGADSSQATADSPGLEKQDRAGASGCLRKIFAILLLINRPVTIKKFIDEGLCDADLPLEKRKGKKMSSSVALSPRGGSGEVRCVTKWKRQSLDSFVESQWQVLSPFLYRDEWGKILHYDFKEPVILPFTEYKSRSSGGHGEVFSAKIHPEHHNFPCAQVSPLGTRILPSFRSGHCHGKRQR